MISTSQSDTESDRPSSSFSADEFEDGANIGCSREARYLRQMDPKTGRPVVSEEAKSRREKRLGDGSGPYRVEAREAFDATNRPEAGIHFHSLHAEDILIDGRGACVRKVNSFEEMNLPKALRENIAKLGYQEPLPIQKATFPLVMDGFDVTAHAQTGGGKTAAFIIPVVAKIIKIKENISSIRANSIPYCIVVSPTKELAEQLYNAAVEFTYGTNCVPFLSMGDTRRAEDIAKLRRGCDMYFGTVGRLLDFVANGVVDLNNVKFFVLDEADDHFAHADSFTDIGDIVLRKCKENSELQILLFSATDTQDVRDFAGAFMRPCAKRVVVGQLNAVSRYVKQKIRKTEECNKRVHLLQIMKEETAKSPASKILVFVNTKRRSTVLACFLSLNGYKAYPINGNMVTSLRREAIVALETGTCRVIVATDVLSRGVDLKDVAIVINYDLPPSEKWAAFVHRIGRTARLGNEGRAITFYRPNCDQSMADLLCQWLASTGHEIPKFLLEDALQMYDGDMQALVDNARKEYLSKSLMKSAFDSDSDTDPTDSD